MMRRRWDRRLPTSRLATGLLACGLAAGLVAGCTSVRNNLGTADSACYLTLPASTRAVGSHARLVGVHLVTLAALRRQTPELFDALAHQPASGQKVCLVAFAGSFTSASVSKPLGKPSGPLAVVITKIPSDEVLGTVIVRGPPLHFGHPHIG